MHFLRADVSKNQTLAGNSQKIDFAHTLKFDTLSCQKNPCAVCFEKYFFVGEKLTFLQERVNMLI